MYWHTYLCTLFMYLHVWTYNHYSVQCSVHVTLDCTCTLFMYLHVWTYNHYSVQCSVHVTLDCTCTLLLDYSVLSNVRVCMHPSSCSGSNRSNGHRSRECLWKTTAPDQAKVSYTLIPRPVFQLLLLAVQKEGRPGKTHHMI